MLCLVPCQSLRTSQVAHQARAYPGFCSMKQLESRAPPLPLPSVPCLALLFYLGHQSMSPNCYLMLLQPLNSCLNPNHIPLLLCWLERLWVVTYDCLKAKKTTSCWFPKVVTDADGSPHLWEPLKTEFVWQFTRTGRLWLHNVQLYVQDRTL